MSINDTLGAEIAWEFKYRYRGNGRFRGQDDTVREGSIDLDAVQQAV